MASAAILFSECLVSEHNYWLVVMMLHTKFLEYRPSCSKVINISFLPLKYIGNLKMHEENLSF
jgi:hypothetical protein